MNAAPIEPGARIASLDALRGVALLGILVANVRQMFLPWDIASFAIPGREGEMLGWLDWGFFDAIVDLKFITLFSLLFGISFALQAERIGVQDDRHSAIYLRRLALLALFGILHGLLLYPAEVLLPYAVAGLLLYGARGMATNNLYRVGVVLVATTIVWGFQIGSLGRISPVITILSATAFSFAVAMAWDRDWRLALVAVAAIMLAAVVALLLRWDPLSWGSSVAGEYAAAMRELAAMGTSDAASWPAEFLARKSGTFADTAVPSCAAVPAAAAVLRNCAVVANARAVHDRGRPAAQWSGHRRHGGHVAASLCGRPRHRTAAQPGRHRAAVAGNPWPL